MRKLFTIILGISLSLLLATCKQFNADIDEYLSYWASEAAIVRYNFASAITVRTDKDTIQSIPSSTDAAVTFIVRNPKKISFKLPGQPTSPADIVVFPTDVAGTTTSSPKQPDDYELTQDSYSQLTLTYKKEFLQKHEYGEKNIGPTITLYAKDGRKFSETFTLNVKANTPPPNLTYRAIGKTAAPDGNGKQYYVLFLEAKGMDTEINGSDLLHKDIAQLSIAEGSGSYTSVPLTVKADKSGFDISGAGGRLLGYSDATALLSADVESGVTPDILPASTEKWILRIKTDVPVGGATKQYRFRLGDEAGLYSSDELKTSTNTNKVKSVEITVTSGTWSVTPKNGTNADPHEIAYQSGTEKILLQAKTATTGAMVYYRLERNGSTVNESSGTTSVTIELPAVPNAVYKLTAWAKKEGYDNSVEKIVCYKTKRTNTVEISAGQNAWGQLKAAVAAAEDGDIFLVNGSIQATNDAGNSGAIEVTKSITIKGKNNDATTDMLDANKDELSTNAHRIFTIKNGGELILEKLTLKNGNAAGTGDQSRGGAMLIESGGTLTMTDCIVQKCIAVNSGGGIDNKGILTINGGMVGSITAGSGNHASMGGGIFLDQGSCTLNGVAVQGNTIGTEIINRGSGIYLSKPSSGSAALTITGRTQIGDNTAGSNTLCLGARSSSQSAFVTAKDLDAAAHINIEPQNYGAQKNTTLVKVPNDASAVASKVYFHLTSVPATEIWELVPDSQDKALILKQAKVINNSGNSWKRLKTAIESAGEGDIIIVDGTIQATSASGNFGDITVSKSITIRGKNGNPATDILDANKDTGGKSAHRIFNVTGGNLTMEGLTLTGGMAIVSGVGANIGGGIYVGVNSRAELKNCIITACKAARVGGGIYSKGELILDNCTIGGEQYYDGIDPAKPKGNTALSGGGVSSNQGNLTIIGGAITYNTADGPGGGISFGSNDKTATLKVTETDISHNKAKETGGGIYLSAPGYSEKYVNATLQDVTVKNNELTSTNVNDWRKGGGGIFFTNYTNGATLTIIGGSIEGNNARNFNGGGIYITTDRDGYVNGTLTLKDGARISGNSAENGGGVAVNSAKLIIEPGCTIGGEQDYDGMDPSKAKGNTAKTSGGGISVGKKAECTIKEGVTIRHNSVTQGVSTVNGGGGLHIYGTSSPADSGTVTITGTQEKPVRIADNEARGLTGVGGGIANNGTITLTHVHISGCKAPDSGGLGGGIYVRRGACTLIDSEVKDCVAQGAGGGVYVYKDSAVSGLFTMQGSSLIVPSSDNVKGKNDIFLRDDACITLSGGLTGATLVGRITVPDGNYNPSTKVLDGNITDGENYKKFTVTPEGSPPSQNWYIDSNGKLTTTPP